MTRKMKDSGIEWIGEIPEEWSIGKVKFATKKIGSGKTPKGGSDVYSNQGVLFIRSQNVYDSGLILDECCYVSDEIDNDMKSTRVFYDDVLLNITGGSIGRCCRYIIKDKHANVNQHVCIIRTYKDKIISKFMYYLWISKVGKISIDIYQSGSNREGMNFEQIGNTLIPYLPIEEQKQITNYLDTKCSKIDETILKEKQVIEKLKQYKQSVITEAVTKGLDPDVKMKDSGVEWIGEIPEDWEVSKVKYLVEFNPSYRGNLSETEEVSFAPMETITSGSVVPKTTTLDKVKSGYTFFCDEDVLMAKVTPCFENGNIAIAKNLINGVGFGSSELYVFRCVKIDNKFMFYFLQNSLFKERCISTMYGTGGLKRVSSSYVYNYKLLKPPIEEQKQIAIYLDKKCASIDKAISNKEKLIEKLTEYKKSLIYECVTGKREV